MSSSSLNVNSFSHSGQTEGTAHLSGNLPDLWNGFIPHPYNNHQFLALSSKAAANRRVSTLSSYSSLSKFLAIFSHFFMFSDYWFSSQDLSFKCLAMKPVPVGGRNHTVVLECSKMKQAHSIMDAPPSL